MSTPQIIIGIDPDVDESGMGIISMNRTGILVDYSTHKLPEMVDTLRNLVEKSEDPVSIYIEAGWLNQGNWHLNPKDNKRLAAAKGRQAGRNHQLGLDLCAWLDHYDIKHTEIYPLAKCWRGKDRKITHEELNEIVRNVNGTGLPRKRSNQEERDALLIAWVKSGLPIKRK